MQKILIAHDLKPLLMGAEPYLERSDIAVFSAATNDEVLKLHVEEHMNLIVSKLDMPGHRTEDVFDIIRTSNDLRRVSLVIACNDDVVHRERARRCGADVVMTLPVDPIQLSAKVQQLLNVAPRQAYRVVLNASVEGKFRNRPFLCKTENVSASGMRIRTGLDLNIGDMISCSFYLPGDSKVAASGEIVRLVAPVKGKEGNSYGVKFTKLSPEVKAAIETFVERESRKKE
ncbi:MAG TPA: PilZ domain-containing protein [Nitrospirota bacterium]